MDAGSHSSVSLNLDTSVRLVEMLKEGLEPDVLLYVVNGLVYQRSGEYSLKGRDGVWRSGSLSVSVPSMESFIEAYNRRHVSFPIKTYSDILDLARQLRIVLSDGKDWVSLPNGMCYSGVAVGKVKVSLCLAGGKYWSSSCDPAIYKQAWMNFESCLGALVDDGWSTDCLDIKCGWVLDDL